MPAVSLVVCVHQEKEQLARLLQQAAGCCDDLVVVHDGPDATGVGEVVAAAGGRFYERPRAFQQEPHWPFAWEQARHDWILRLDADEFPGGELKLWLQEFRRAPEPPPEVSGYTCIWPLWNGQRAVTRNWPGGRNFLFHRQRVRFFGMAETAPYPDGRVEPLPFVLCHEPGRKSYGLANLLFRRQAYRWRRVIARSLLGPVTELPGWRWTSADWPPEWEAIRQRPWRTGFSRLIRGPVRQAREMWRIEGRIIFSAVLGTGIHQFLMAATFCFFRWGRGNRVSPR